MKIEAQGLRIADVVRVPMRGEGEVARRDDFGREVRIWFRGSSEDDPLPSVVFDATTILEVERPGSLFETPQQADRRELVRRVVEALERVGWTYHAANGESVDHLHDPAGLVRVEFQADRVVLFTKSKQGERWQWSDSGVELATIAAFEADFANLVAKLETTALLLLWEFEQDPGMPEPAANVAPPVNVATLPKPEPEAPLRVRYSLDEGVLICGDTRSKKDVIADLRTPYRFQFSPNLPEGCAWYVANTRGTYQPDTMVRAVADQLRMRGVAATVDYARSSQRAASRARDPKYPRTAAEQLALWRKHLVAEGWSYHPPQRAGTKVHSLIDPTDTVRLATDRGGFELQSRMPTRHHLVSGWERTDMHFDDLAAEQDFEHAVRLLVAYAHDKAAQRAIAEVEADRYLPKSEQKPVPEGAEPLRIHYSRDAGVLLCGNTYEHRAVIGKLHTPYRFKPSRNLPGDCYWYVQGTRGTFEPRSRIENLATVLRARGIATSIDYIDPEAIVGTPSEGDAKPMPVEARVEAIAERHGLITTRFPKPEQVEAALLDAVREGVGQDLRRWLTRTGKAPTNTATMLLAKARGRIALETNVWPPEGERGRYDVHEYEGVLASLIAEPTIAEVLAAAERWPSQLEALAGPEAPLLYDRSDLAFAKLVPETIKQRVDAAVRASFYAKGKKAPPVPVTAKQVRAELVPRVEQLGRVMAATLDPVLYDRKTTPREILDRLCKVSTAYAVHVLAVLRELPISSESEIDMVCRGARTLDSVLASNYRKKIDEKLAEADEIERTSRDARAIGTIAKGVEILTVASFNAEYQRRYPDVDPDWLMRRSWRQKPHLPPYDKMAPAGQSTAFFVRGPIFGRQFNIGDSSGDERKAVAAFLEVISHQDDPDGLAYVRGEVAELEAKAAAAGVEPQPRAVQKPVVVPPPMPVTEAPASDSADARIDALLAAIPAITTSNRPDPPACYEAILVAEREGLGRAMRAKLVRADKLDAGIGTRLLGRARALLALEAGAWPPKPIRGEAYSDHEFEGVLDVVARMPEVAETLALAGTWREEMRKIAGANAMHYYGNLDLEVLTKQSHDLVKNDLVDRARSHARRGEPMTREVAQAARDQIVARVKDRRVLLERSLDARLYDRDTDRIWAKEALCKISPRVAERVLAELHGVAFSDPDDADRLCAGQESLLGLEMKAKAKQVERSRLSLTAAEQQRADAQSLLHIFEQVEGEPSIKRFNLAYWRTFPAIPSHDRDEVRLRAEHFDGTRMVERVGPADVRTTLKVRGPKRRLFLVTGSGSEVELLELLRRTAQGVVDGDAVVTAQAELDEAHEAAAADGHRETRNSGQQPSTSTPSTTRATPGRKPDRKKQADKLRVLARSMLKRADDEIEAPRLENTRRRADMATSIRGRAYGEQRVARTLLLAADEVERGELTYMGRLSSRAQVEDLDEALSRARYMHRRANQALRESDDKPSEPTMADVEFAEYRGLEMYGSQRRGILKASIYVYMNDDHTRERLRAVLETDDEATDIRGDDLELVRAALEKIKKSSEKPNYDVQKAIEELARVDRLARLGIRDTPTLRAALREYVGCCRGQVSKAKDDPIAARKRELQFMKIPGYFPTPRELAERLVSAAEIEPGMRVLEPSAGSGSIAEVIRERHPDATLELIEFNYTLRQILTDQGFTLLESNDFTSFDPGERRYDRIVMNPPFEDRQDSGHIERALGMLAPGGRLVAIASGSFPMRSDKGTVALREKISTLGGMIEKLPEGSFTSSGTGASTVMIVVDVPAAKPVAVAKPEKAAKAVAKPEKAAKPAAVAATAAVAAVVAAEAGKPDCAPCKLAAEQGKPKPTDCGCKHGPFEHAEDRALLDANLERATRAWATRQGLRLSPGAPLPPPALEHVAFASFAPQLITSVEILWLLNHDAKPDAASKRARAKSREMAAEHHMAFVPNADEAKWLEAVVATATSERGVLNIRKSIEQSRIHARLGIHDDESLREVLRRYLVEVRGVSEGAAVELPKISGYQPTPPELAAKLVELAEIQPGMLVLEPMAGTGTIARLIRERHPDARLHVVERNRQLNDDLEAQGFEVMGWDIGGYDPRSPYDRIVVHPPEDEQLEVVLRLRRMLVPGAGRLVALLSADLATRKDETARRFRDAMTSAGGRFDKLPGGTVLVFPVATSAVTRVVDTAPASKTKPKPDMKQPKWAEGMSVEQIVGVEALHGLLDKWDAFRFGRRSDDGPWPAFGTTGCMAPVPGDPTLTVCVTGNPRAAGACPPLPKSPSPSRKLALCEDGQPVAWFGGNRFKTEIRAEVANRLARRRAATLPIKKATVLELPALDDFEGQHTLLRQLVPTMIVFEKDMPNRPLPVELLPPRVRKPGSDDLESINLGRNQPLADGEQLVACVNVGGVAYELAEFVKGLDSHWTPYLGPIAINTLHELTRKLNAESEQLDLDFRSGMFGDDNDTLYWVEKDGAVVIEPILADGEMPSRAAMRAFAAARAGVELEPVALPEGWAPDDTVVIAARTSGVSITIVWQPGNGMYTKRTDAGEWERPSMGDSRETMIDLVRQSIAVADSRARDGEPVRVSGAWVGAVYPTDFPKRVVFDEPTGGTVDVELLMREYAEALRLAQDAGTIDAEYEEWLARSKRRIEWARKWQRDAGKPKREAKPKRTPKRSKAAAPERVEPVREVEVAATEFAPVVAANEPPPKRPRKPASTPAREPASIAAPITAPPSEPVPSREQEQPTMSKKASKKSSAKSAAAAETPKTTKKSSKAASKKATGKKPGRPKKAAAAETPKTTKKGASKAAASKAPEPAPTVAETPKTTKKGASKKGASKKGASKKGASNTDAPKPVAAISPIQPDAPACVSDDSCPPELEHWRRRVRAGDRVRFRKNSRIAAALGIDTDRVFEVRCVVCERSERYAVLNVVGTYDVKIPIGQFSIVERKPTMPADVQACVAKLAKLGGPISEMTRKIVAQFASGM